MPKNGTNGGPTIELAGELRKELKKWRVEAGLQRLAKEMAQQQAAELSERCRVLARLVTAGMPIIQAAIGDPRGPRRSGGRE